MHLDQRMASRRVVSWLAPGGWLLVEEPDFGMWQNDAELDIVRPTTPLAEFYRLSMAALAGPSAATGTLTPEQAAALVERPADPHFLGCGFAHIGAWGRRPASPAT